MDDDSSGLPYTLASDPSQADPSTVPASDPSTPAPATGGTAGGGGSFSDVMSSVDPTAGKIIQAVEREDDPTIKSLTAREIQQTQRALQTEGQLADYEEKQAKLMANWEPQEKQLIEQMPTRQGVYATNAHVMPLLAILSAIGGKTARLSGLDMLGATNGIITGVNEGNDQAYNDATQKWKEKLQAFQDHLALQQHVFATMEKAYGTRLDAQEKAAAATERMLNNVRTEQQKKLTTALQAYHGQQQIGVELKKLGAYQESLALRKQMMAAQDPAVQGLIYKFEAAGLRLPQRTAVMVAQGAIALGLSDEDAVSQVRAGRGAQIMRDGMMRVMGRRGGMQLASTGPLIEKGGLYDQLDEAALAYSKTLKGLSKGQIISSIENAISKGVYTSPAQQRYVTKLEETRTELKNSLASMGVPSDKIAEQTERELPAWKGYEALHAGIGASKEVNKAIISGNYHVAQLVAAGKDPMEIVKDEAMSETPKEDTKAAAPGRIPTATGKTGDSGTFKNPLKPPGNPADFKPGSYYDMPASPGRPMILDDNMHFHHTDENGELLD